MGDESFEELSYVKELKSQEEEQDTNDLSLAIQKNFDKKVVICPDFKEDSKKMSLIYALNSTKRLIYKLPLDLSGPPTLHFECKMNEKMEKVYASKDGFYLIVVFADQSTVIVINNVLKQI